MADARKCLDCHGPVGKWARRCDVCKSKHVADVRRARARRKGKTRHVPSDRTGYLGRRGTEAEYFWAKVRKTNSCWVWTAAKVKGYGKFQKHRAHRWSYEHLVGPIPEGLTLDHLCRNRACVNPEHLEPVTVEENVRRAAA